MYYLLVEFLSDGQCDRNAFLKRAYKCGLCSNLITVEYLYCLAQLLSFVG